MPYLSNADISSLGFASIGTNVKISRHASIYGAGNITLGNNVRIDDFCVISAGSDGIFIGSYVHIAIYSSLIGKARIEMMDYSGLSARVSVYSSSDDYTGMWMTNPTISDEFTHVIDAPVTIGKHAIVGAGSVILPGSILESGVAVGALSLVKGRCKEFGVYFGIPARRISERKRNVLVLENELIASTQLKGITS